MGIFDRGYLGTTQFALNMQGIGLITTAGMIFLVARYAFKSRDHIHDLDYRVRSHRHIVNPGPSEDGNLRTSFPEYLSGGWY